MDVVKEVKTLKQILGIQSEKFSLQCLDTVKTTRALTFENFCDQAIATGRL
jgi:hypothetical protein